MVHEELKEESLLIEEYGEVNTESPLVSEHLMPYLRDLFGDLVIRSIEPAALKAQQLDKTTFIEFSSLPCVVAERLFSIFDTPSTGTLTLKTFADGLL